MYTFSKCCSHLSEDEGVNITTVIGNVSLALYRGPSQHNAPKFNERTVEVSLGLWFMRRALRLADPTEIIEIGNVMSNYWPKEDYIQMQQGIYLPWQLADLEVNQDATLLSFEARRVLSISTLEHVGHDNEGASHLNGFRSDGSLESIEEWVSSWDLSPQLLLRIAHEAKEFLVTFPVGLNLRLDEVVTSNAWLRNRSRVLRRKNAQNAWEVDHDFQKSPSLTFHRYHYDLRDAYLPETIGLMFHPDVPGVYHRIYGTTMPFRGPPPPWHPKFRFANAVCLVTNIPELLR